MKKKSRGLRGFANDVLGLSALGPVGRAILIAIPVTAAALFYVWTHIESVRLGYELSDAAETHEVLFERNKSLKVDVAAHKAPQRLERMGKKYGLRPPRPEQIIRVDGDDPAGARP